MNTWVKECEYSGHLFVFEGIDGSGKSQNAKNISQRLKAEGQDVVNFMEPSNGSFGKQIREAASERRLPDSTTLLDLFIKDRIENRDKNLLPSLKGGKIVILDRYFYSNIAYQGVELSPQCIFELNKHIVLNPDMTFIFDVSVDIAISRITRNRGKTTEFEKKEYLKKVKAIYDCFEASNIRKIDAHRDLNTVCREIYECIVNLL